MIIGSSGSGKSTLARELGKITKLPVVHIDKMYWEPGWVLRPSEETHALVSAAVEADQWIFDGNNSSSFECRISRADTLIFLDFPAYLCVYRVIARVIKYKMGEIRPDMTDGCPERFDWEFVKFLKWIYDYKKRGGWQNAMDLYASAPPQVSRFHLKNRKSVKEFLDKAKTL